MWGSIVVVLVLLQCEREHTIVEGGEVKRWDKIRGSSFHMYSLTRDASCMSQCGACDQLICSLRQQHIL
jgi:hypothetical protein